MDEMTPEVARTEIERMRGTDEIKNVMHPSHEAALRTPRLVRQADARVFAVAPP